MVEVNVLAVPVGKLCLALDHYINDITVDDMMHCNVVTVLCWRFSILSCCDFLGEVEVKCCNVLWDALLRLSGVILAGDMSVN